MRVLMISANRTRQPIPVIPFGACLVAQSARRAGHDVRFLDLMFARDFAARLVRQLTRDKAWPPDVVGLSVRNIDTNDVRNPLALADEAARLVKIIRGHSNATIVLGGAALGVMPRQFLARTGADWAVQAEGETVFPRLLAALADRAAQDPASIAGVIGPHGGPAWTDRSGDGSLADCTVADFAQWVDVGAYLSRMATVPVQTKRGCPFDCVYCTYSMVEGRDYRLHPPEQVVKAITELVAQGHRDIEFVDNVFNSPYEHALAICRGLASARAQGLLPRVRLHTTELNPRFLDDELLATMRQAGFVSIGLTVESAADEVLAGLRKGYAASDVHKAARMVGRLDLPCLWLFMLGGPGETQATVRQTLDFARACIRPTDTVFFQIGIRIYPGTELERRAREEYVLTASADDMLAPVFYLSPGVTLDWLKAELAAATREQLNFVAADSIRLPLLQNVLRLSYRMGMRPPLWRHSRGLRRVLKWLHLHP